MQRLLSPRQVANSLGVSESSLKRWCDRGEMAFERTAGGHRRIPVRAVVRFLRRHRREVVRPDILGLPSAATRASSLGQSVELLVDCLAKGDAAETRRVIFEFFLAGHDVSSICDELITPSLCVIGDLWECGKVEVFQEHRAVEVTLRVLHELRITLETTADDLPVAMGGAVEGDNYGLPTRMVELTLLDCGWKATSFGSSLPMETLLSAARQNHPRLVWLSASVVKDEKEFVESVVHLCEGVPPSTSVVVGGRAVTAGVHGLSGATVCSDLRSLVDFSLQLRTTEVSNAG